MNPTPPRLPPRLPPALPPAAPVLRENSAGVFGPNSYMAQLQDGRMRLDIHGEVFDLVAGNGPHRICSIMGRDEARAVAVKLLEYANG